MAESQSTDPRDAEIARLRAALEDLASTPIIECLSAETWRLIMTDQTAYIRAVLEGQAAVDALRAEIEAEGEPVIAVELTVMSEPGHA